MVKKHSIGEILTYREDIASKLEKIDNFDDEKHRLEKQLIASRNAKRRKKKPSNIVF